MSRLENSEIQMLLMVMVLKVLRQYCFAEIATRAKFHFY